MRAIYPFGQPVLQQSPIQDAELCMSWKGSVTRRGEKEKENFIEVGCQEIIISLITELEFELDVERINYLCRKCTGKLKNFEEKKEELLSLLKNSNFYSSAENVPSPSPLAPSPLATSQVPQSSSHSPDIIVS